MSRLSTIYKIIGIPLVIVALGVGAYFIYGKTVTVDPIEAAKQEATTVKKALSKHLVLPENDEPDIRKINQKLDDPFFANAAIGDYLIIFYKSRIAYTYSLERNIITNAGVVFINPQQATSTKR